MKKGLKVVFQPEGRTTYVLPGTSIIEAAGEAGIVIGTPCGGKGTCGKCRVEISRNAPAPTSLDKKHFNKDELARGARLACQTQINSEIVINVPSASRFYEQKILEAGEWRDVEHEPMVKPVHIQLPHPTIEDQRSDCDRLLDGLAENGICVEGCPAITLPVIRRLPAAVREKGYDLTAILADSEIIDVLPGHVTGHCYGVAFDIGTTTVVGMLVCLDEKRPIQVAARTNPQVRFGDDVVSRIEHAQNTDNGLRELQESIVGCLNTIITELCKKADINREKIYEAVIAGNTTMSHLLLRIDPSNLAQSPYVATFRSGVAVTAREVKLDIHKNGKLFVLPNIAGFVGGDTVAVMLATNLTKADGARLVLDLGTNGEVVLAKDGKFVACSTAAGPAFEGARITFGMRAAEGAIEKVVFTNDVETSTVGNRPAIGLCGSSIIDIVAELLKSGIVDKMGRMLPRAELPEDLPASLRDRVIEDDDGLRFILAYEDETQINGPVYVTQRDVREVQLAKGAMACGMSILMREMGIGPEDLDEVLLAGAFGNFIRRSNARRIGLLPNVEAEKIRFVGNAAGAGSHLSLISRKCREEAEIISKATHYIELAGRTDFQMEFAEAMLFPEE